MRKMFTAGWHCHTTQKSMKLRCCWHDYMFDSVRTHNMGGSDSQQHPKPLRLFDIARGEMKPTEREALHIRDCANCKIVLAVFAKQVNPKNPPPSKSNPGNAA